ncbi:MAG TPA: CYTH domain-containing protein [Candidatus Acidoferrales bacterium]|nr:CYTH domain-containing protein [Candidatus Acidoferrales bacterium]
MPRKSDTHRETEIKLAVKDLHGLIEKLHALGIKPRGRVLERNTLFDTDGSDLRSRGRLLRLRTETPAPSAFAVGGPERMVLTAKSPAPPEGALGKRDLYKQNLEREVVLRASKRAPGAKRTLVDRGWPFALGCLGLRSKFRYEKYRTAFRVKDVHLELDETPVGTFLELEGKPEAIDRLAHDLGFAPKDYMRATYFDLYSAERRKKGRPVRHMLF